MFRQLCFAAIAVLFAAGTCSANFVIDDFNNYANGDSGAGLSATGDGAANADVSVLTMVGPPNNGLDTLQFSSAGGDFEYNAAVSADDMFSITYDFMGQTLVQFSGLGPSANFTGLTFADSAVPAANLSLAITDHNGNIVNSGNLNAAESLTFKYTAIADVPSQSLTFGSQTFPLTAVPEPTSLLMFSSVMGLALIPRRRRR